MGGFSGGNSTGGGGGVGPAGRKTSGSYGTKRDAQRASRRNEGRKAAKAVSDFVSGGGITGAILSEIAKAVDPGRNRKSKSGDVYGADEAKEKIDYKAPASMDTGRDGENNNQGIEVAKAASKADPVTEKVQKAAVDASPKGPTSVEMPEESEAERLLRIKRKGRRATILNVPDDELTLSKKVLLG